MPQEKWLYVALELCDPCTKGKKAFLAQMRKEVCERLLAGKVKEPEQIEIINTHTAERIHCGTSDITLLLSTLDWD